MLKKISKLFLIFVLFSLVFTATSSLAQDDFSDSNKEVDIYFFWGYGCPHCNAEKPFLEKIQQKYSNLEVHSFEVTKNKENIDLLKKIGLELSVDTAGIPFTVVGKQYFIGWHSEQTTGLAIEKAFQNVLKNGDPDIVSSLITPITPNPIPEKPNNVPEKIHLPFLGEIEIKNFSLPVLTIIIAGMDGFNPCAMWVLLFLITLLLEMKNKKRMWILGTVFIVTSGFVYFLFMSAWLNLFLFLGFIFWVRIIIGLVSFGAGIYNLKEYFTNPAGVCKITSGKKRQKVFEKLKLVIHKQQFHMALIGIIILAFAVNLVELICSAGLPAVYTQILTLTELTKIQYYLYLSLYIFIFMLDDLFVFFVAMITLQITGVTTKYTRFSHLFGGIIMLIIGILLIFKPEILMFG